MLYQMTRYEDAIRAYETALGKMPKTTQRGGLFSPRWGKTYRYWGRLADAELWFRKAISMLTRPKPGPTLCGMPGSSV